MSTTREKPTEKRLNWVDRRFGLTRWGVTWQSQLLAGLVIALSISYIFPLNPIILTGSPATDVPSFHALATATAIVAVVTTFLMGFFGRIPIALAAGLGVNSIIAYQIAPAVGWGGAAIVLVLEGALVLILVMTRVREKLFRAIPMLGRKGIAAAIGAFLILISLADGGIVKGAPVGAALNFQNLVTFPRLVFVLVAAVILVLAFLKVRAAIIIGIVGGTVLSIIVEGIFHFGAYDAEKNPGGWALNVPWINDWNKVVEPPDLSSFFQFDVSGLAVAGPAIVVGLVLTVALIDLVDTLGTVTAVGDAAGVLNKKTGEPDHLRWILGIDAFAAMLGGASGSSGATSYIESASGAKSGAKTGLAAIFAAMFFLIAIPAAALMTLFPSEATAPALFVVGVLLLKDFFVSFRDELLETFENAVSALEEEVDGPDAPTGAAVVGSLRRTLEGVKAGILKETPIVIATVTAVVTMPFTYSITNGVGVLVLIYVLLMTVSRQGKQVHPLMWIMSVVFLIYFLAPLVGSWIGS